jgi:hypothetical protein
MVTSGGTFKVLFFQALIPKKVKGFVLDRVRKGSRFRGAQASRRQVRSI